MILQAIELVRWRIRTVLTYKDILRLLRVGTFVILTYLVANFKTIFSTPPPPTNYELKRSQEGQIPANIPKTVGYLAKGA